MKIALLGLGTVGGAVYKAITEKKTDLFKDFNVEIKYVLVRTKENKSFALDVLTLDYEEILNDEEIEVVIEMMGARVSYDYIKQALNHHKNVITANKEVIASHFKELEELAKKNNVKLLYEASVGGSIPIIGVLSDATMVNEITTIKGILNGTCNYILTNMHKNKMNFNDALALAQENGFAEADPSADLKGLDMVRKIKILSEIAYKSEIDLDKIYSYGIENINKEIIDVIDLLGYSLKLMCYSRLEDENIYIGVEPFMLNRDDLCNVNYEFNVVEYIGSNCDKQIMVGKGAGIKTANSILIDLKKFIYGYNSNYKIVNNYKTIGGDFSCFKYFIKPIEELDMDLIDINLGDFYITKKLNYEEFKLIQNKISFYAKIN